MPNACPNAVGANDGRELLRDSCLPTFGKTLGDMSLPSSHHALQTYDIIVSMHASEFQRELDDLSQGQAGKRLLERLIVDRDVARRPGPPGSGDRTFPSSGCILRCHRY